MRVLLLVLLPVLLFAGAWQAKGWWQARSGKMTGPARHPGEPVRIIGLAPSTVEILFELGLGDQVVGVSRFSKHPPEALEKPEIGVFMEIEFERLLALEPDHVVMAESQQSLEEKFHRFGLATLRVDHASVAGILDSIGEIGRSFDREERAAGVVAGIRGRMDEVDRRIAGKPKPRVLICIERDVDTGKPSGVVAAGSAGFHQELIALSGAQNAYAGPIPFPMLSREDLIELDPDVIIDLTRDEFVQRIGADELLAQWDAFGELGAVRNRRVVLLVGNQHVIPGPRFIDTLEAFAGAIHPQPGN